MKNKIATNRKFRQGFVDYVILERTDLFGFASCENVNNSGHPYFNTGTFYADENGNEQFRPVFMLDLNEYNNDREKVYASYQASIEAHNKKLERETANARLAKEKAATNAGINKIAHEAVERKKVLAQSIRDAVLQSDSLKTLMNDKEVKDQITELAQLNTLFTGGIFTNLI